MRLLSFALAALLLTFASPASADHFLSVRYVATNEQCQLEAELHHENRFDPTSALEIDIFIASVEVDGMRVEPACGSHFGGIYCEGPTGSHTEGLFCQWGEWYQRILIGGTNGAPEIAPGVFSVSIGYYGWQFDATASVLE